MTYLMKKHLNFIPVVMTFMFVFCMQSHAAGSSTDPSEIRYKISLEDAVMQMQEGEFYITQRLTNGDSFWGNIQNFFDDINSNDSFWVAYDVKYVLGTARPGDTEYVIEASYKNPFQKTGNYRFYYVRLDKTIKTKDSRGFQQELPVLLLISDPDAIYEAYEEKYAAEDPNDSIDDEYQDGERVDRYNMLGIYKVYNCKTSITLRSEASTSAKERCQIPLNDTVIVIDFLNNGFAYVEYEKPDGLVVHGYVLSKYLKEL